MVDSDVDAVPDIGDKEYSEFVSETQKKARSKGSHVESVRSTDEGEHHVVVAAQRPEKKEKKLKNWRIWFWKNKM